MKKAALSEVKDDLSKFLRQAEKEEVVITRHGRPAGILIGFDQRHKQIKKTSARLIMIKGLIRI
jgi:prevent-host-death family protein